MVRDILRSIYDRVQQYFQEAEDDGPIQVLGVLQDSGRWSCRFCSRNKFQKKYPDLFRHVWSEHYWVTEEDDAKNESSSGETLHDDFSVGDFVDDYSLPETGSSEEKSKSIQLQEPTGGQGFKQDRIKSRFSEIFDSLEEDGKFVIRRTTHVGALRGGNILLEFKSAVRRLDDWSLDELEIENDGNGYPVTIMLEDMY